MLKHSKKQLKDCHLVFGTSARSRTIPWPLLDVRPASKEAIKAAAQGQQIAIVFGREDRGLTNEELAFGKLSPYYSCELGLWCT